MTENGLSNTMKVELAGVTRRSINAIETGRMVPSVLLALRIARALDVRVEELFSLGEGAASE
jgi:putative transcriptional regulator